MRLDHAPRRRWSFPLLLLRRKTARWYRRAKHEVFEIEGDCLRGWLTTGNIVYVDRMLEPEDGELCLVNMLYRRGLMLGAGSTCRRLSVKQLRYRDGVRWLDSADGCTCDERHEIVGTVVGYYRGWRFSPSLKTMSFPFKPIGAEASQTVTLGAVRA